MLKTILLLIICISSVANSLAGLYTCSDVDSTPIPKTEDLNSIKLSLHKTKAHLKANYSNSEFHKGKAPFLIYYAVDSAEPFMQYSVRFEIAKLIMACQSSKTVNFVAFLNSLYTERNEFILCKDKTITHINVSRYPSLNSSLLDKRQYISEGDHTGSETGPLNYLVRYYPHTNAAFARFPLAHPDFLHDLIKLAISDEDLFPQEKYLPFIHLKAHGNDKAVLSGLHDCQLRAKILSQEQILKTQLNTSEHNLLKRLSTPLEVASHLKTYETILNKLYLGSSAGVGVDTSAQGLGEYSLGEYSLGSIGLGNLITGLGAGEGLGAKYTFGIYHVNANAVLRDLFDFDTKRSLGFIMFEACDTKRDPDFHHKYIGNVLGFYSAKHSLWYRNINWWSLLENASGSSLSLLDQLKERTALIENIEVTE